MGIERFPIKGLAGLRAKSSVNNAQGNTLRTGENFRRNRAGLLELTDGYSSVHAFPTPSTSLYKITTLSWKRIGNFYVSDHGGQLISIAVATYRKTGWMQSPPTLDRFGVWIRPYWSGAAWVDEWRELTEMYIFELRSKVATNRLFVDDVTAGFNFKGITGYSAVFNTSYFNDWTLMFGTDFTAAGDDENYLAITGSGFDGSDYFYLDFWGDITNLSTRSAGDRITVYRSWANMELPSTIDAWIHRVAQSIRVTSGNNLTDTSIYGGLKTKTWGWSNPNGSIDKVIGETGVLNYWRRCWGTYIPVATAEATDPLPAGTYSFKQSLQLDDGNETDLRNIQDVNTMILSASTVTALGGNNARPVVTDGTYAYVGTGDSPAKIVKILLADMSIVATLTLSSGENAPQFLHIATDGFLYASIYVSPGIVVKINPTTLTRVGAVALTAGENGALGMGSDATYLYVVCEAIGSSSAPAGLARIALSTFAEVGAAVAFTYASGEVAGRLVAVLGTEAFVYCNNPSNPVKVVTVDLSGWTKGSTATWGAGLYPCNEISNIIAGTYVLVTLEKSPGTIVVSDLTAGGSDTASWNLASGENLPRGIYYDGTYAYVVTNTDPAYVIVNTGYSTASRFRTHTATGYAAGMGLIVDSGYIRFVSGSVPSYLVQVKKSASTSVTLGGDQKVSLQPLLSPGTFPRRARYLNIYMSKDNNGLFYLVKQIGLLTGEHVWEGAAFYDPILEHEYIRGNAFDLKGVDWGLAEALAEVRIGREMTDTGISQYALAMPLGNRVYIAGARIGGVINYNSLIGSTIHGENTTQYDVFGNIAANILDVEFNDGDRIVGLVSVTGDAILVLKQFSIVLLTPNGSVWTRQVVYRGDGLVSKDAVTVVDDAVYWAGYYGIYRYSPTKGLEELNPFWRFDWVPLSTATKQAARMGYDGKNRKVRLAVNGIDYVFVIGEDDWDVENLLDQPSQYDQELGSNALRFLSSSTIYKLPDGITFAGSLVSGSFETNVLRPEIEGALDYLFLYLYFRYSSNVNLNVYVYEDEDSTPIATANPATLPKESNEAEVELGLSTKAKGIRIKITAAQGVVTDTVKLYYFEVYYQPMAVLGSDKVLTWQ